MPPDNPFQLSLPVTGGWADKYATTPMPPPANGGRYGSPDEDWWRKMIRSVGGGAPRAYDPRSSAALQMRRAPEGEFASRGNLVSPQLAEILNIGSKIAGLV